MNSEDRQYLLYVQNELEKIKSGASNASLTVYNTKRENVLTKIKKAYSIVIPRIYKILELKTGVNYEHFDNVPNTKHLTLSKDNVVQVTEEHVDKKLTKYVKGSVQPSKNFADYENYLRSLISKLCTLYNIQVNKEKYIPNTIIDQRYWGNAIWAFLHLTSFLLQDAMNKKLITFTLNYPLIIYNIELLLPCSMCVSHYVEMKLGETDTKAALKLLGIVKDLSFGLFVQGTFKFHNIITTNINNQIKPLQKINASPGNSTNSNTTQQKRKITHQDSDSESEYEQDDDDFDIDDSNDTSKIKVVSNKKKIMTDYEFALMYNVLPSYPILTELKDYMKSGLRISSQDQIITMMVLHLIKNQPTPFLVCEYLETLPDEILHELSLYLCKEFKEQIRNRLKEIPAYKKLFRLVQLYFENPYNTLYNQLDETEQLLSDLDPKSSNIEKIMQLQKVSDANNKTNSKKVMPFTITSKKIKAK